MVRVDSWSADFAFGRFGLYGYILPRNLIHKLRHADGLYLESRNRFQGKIMSPVSHSSHGDPGGSEGWYFVPSGRVMVLGSYLPLAPARPVIVRCRWSLAAMRRSSMNLLSVMRVS